MIDFNSIDYYQRRERIERELAHSATDHAISAIHLEMASRYADLIADAARRVRKRPPSTNRPAIG